jgi:hypothetical protein
MENKMPDKIIKEYKDVLKKHRLYIDSGLYYDTNKKIFFHFKSITSDIELLKIEKNIKDNINRVFMSIRNYEFYFDYDIRSLKITNILDIQLLIEGINDIDILIQDDRNYKGKIVFDKLIRVE